MDLLYKLLKWGEAGFRWKSGKKESFYENNLVGKKLPFSVFYTIKEHTPLNLCYSFFSPSIQILNLYWIYIRSSSFFTFGAKHSNSFSVKPLNEHQRKKKTIEESFFFFLSNQNFNFSKNKSLFLREKIKFLLLSDEHQILEKTILVTDWCAPESTRNFFSLVHTR